MVASGEPKFKPEIISSEISVSFQNYNVQVVLHLYCLTLVAYLEALWCNWVYNYDILKYPNFTEKHLLSNMTMKN